jgi:hypothetical protein
MKITPDVFEAYLKCPTKCWLRSSGEPSAGNTYSEWVKTQNDSYRRAIFGSLWEDGDLTKEVVQTGIWLTLYPLYGSFRSDILSLTPLAA